MLSRVGSPEACAAEILRRRHSLDDGDAERDLVSDWFVEKLSDRAQPPDRGCLPPVGRRRRVAQRLLEEPLRHGEGDFEAEGPDHPRAGVRDPDQEGEGEVDPRLGRRGDGSPAAGSRPGRFWFDLPLAPFALRCDRGLVGIPPRSHVEHDSLDVAFVLIATSTLSLLDVVVTPHPPKVTPVTPRSHPRRDRVSQVFASVYNPKLGSVTLLFLNSILGESNSPPTRKGAMTEGR